MEFVKYSTKNRIAFITIDRPDKRNALNDQLVNELTEAFSQAAENKKAKVIILKASGEVFCAGADLAYLRQLQNNSFEENLVDSRNLKQLFYTIYTSKKLVIAQVQGHAIAGGAGLVTVCDFAFTRPEAKFGYTEVKIGFVPAIVMIFLVRKIGETKAKDLLLTGNLIEAKEAKYYGLVNRIFPADKLASETLQFAENLCTQNSSDSMALTKQMLGKIHSLPLEDALEYAAQMNAQARATQDCHNGIAAFLDKKNISW